MLSRPTIRFGGWGPYLGLEGDRRRSKPAARPRELSTRFWLVDLVARTQTCAVGRVSGVLDRETVAGSTSAHCVSGKARTGNNTWWTCGVAASGASPRVGCAGVKGGLLATCATAWGRLACPLSDLWEDVVCPGIKLSVGVFHGSYEPKLWIGSVGTRLVGEGAWVSWRMGRFLGSVIPTRLLNRVEGRVRVPLFPLLACGRRGLYFA